MNMSMKLKTEGQKLKKRKTSILMGEEKAKMIQQNKIGKAFSRRRAASEPAAGAEPMQQKNKAEKESNPAAESRKAASS